MKNEEYERFNSPVEITDQTQKSKRRRVSVTGEAKSGAAAVEGRVAPSVPAIVPGQLVVSLFVPGSVRGSYDTVRSCHIVSMSNGLRDGRKGSRVNDQVLSEIDSDSEDTAKAFLAALKNQKRVRDRKAYGLIISFLFRGNRVISSFLQRHQPFPNRIRRERVRLLVRLSLSIEGPRHQ